MTKKDKGKLVNLGIYMFALIVTTSIVVMSFAMRNVYENKTDLYTTIVGLKKPSYDYLKSVTVQIQGRAKQKKEISLYGQYYKTLGNTKVVGWGGTGVVIKEETDATYILTNAHVAGNNFDNPMLAVKTEGKFVEVEIVKYHDVLDMAILKLNKPMPEKRVVRGFSTAKPQDPVFVVGHHLGRPYIYGEGVFAGYDGIYNLIQIPCLYGNSGSGVYNQNGEMIALVFAITRYGMFSVDTTHALAVDGISVKFFLKSLDLL